VSDNRLGAAEEPDESVAQDQQRLQLRAPTSAAGRRPLAATIAAAVAVTVALVIVLGTRETEVKPSGGPGPRGGTVLFSDTFSGGDYCDYNRVQNRKFSGPACKYHDTSYALRTVDGAARFEVRPGDSPGGGLGGGERSEISQDSASWQATEGDEWYVHERLRLSEDFEPERWTIITQFHAGSGSPPLSLQVSRKGALILRSSGKAGQVNVAAGKGDRELVPADDFLAMRGQWFEVDLHVRWSNRPGVGGTEVYVDGKLVAPWRDQRTMASSRIYWKAGIYRAPADTTQVLWLDDLVISAPEGGRR
jgi:hypothetical protein